MHRRSLLFGAVLVFGLGGCVTTQPYVPQEIVKVVEIPGKSKDEIFTKSRQWFSQYFVSGESVVDYENQEAGTIIGNGIAENGRDPFGLVAYDFHYNMRIDIKDEKFRATTSITKHTNTDSKSTYDTSYVDDERKRKAEAKVSSVVEDLKNYIQSDKVNSDW